MMQQNVSLNNILIYNELNMVLIFPLSSSSVLLLSLYFLCFSISFHLQKKQITRLVPTH